MDLSQLFPGSTPDNKPVVPKLSLSAENFLPMLHMAVQDRDETQYFYLVSQGADPLLRLPAQESEDNFFLDEDDEHYAQRYQPERGLLWIALRGGCPQIVRDLLDRGEDPNDASGDAFSPLSRWVLSFGEGNASGHVAGWRECGEILLEYGADPNLKEKSGGGLQWKTALKLAESRPDTGAWGVMKSFLDQKNLSKGTPEVTSRPRNRL